MINFSAGIPDSDSYSSALLDSSDASICFTMTFEMFHGRMSFNSVLLQLLVNFLSGFRLELISLIANIRSNLTYLCGFQLLVLLL